MKKKVVEEEAPAMELITKVPEPEEPAEMECSVENCLDVALGKILQPVCNCSQEDVHVGLSALCLKANREAESKGLRLVRGVVHLEYVDENGADYSAGIEIFQAEEN